MNEFLDNLLHVVDTCTHLLIRLYNKVSKFPVSIPYIIQIFTTKPTN